MAIPPSRPPHGPHLTTWGKTGTDSRSDARIFPLAEVARRIHGPGRSPLLQQSPFGFSGTLASGASVILEARPLDRLLPHRRRLVEEVRVRYRFSGLQRLSAWEVPDINQLSCLGGLVRVEEGEGLEFVAKVGLFEGDEASARRVYAPLMARSMVAADWIVRCLAEGIRWVDPARSPFRHAHEPSPLLERDLRSAQEWILEPRGWFGVRDSWGLTAEYPWDPRGGTCLLWVRQDTHPFLGNGVLATLEVPLPLAGEEPTALMEELNGWEMETPELPPYFGAWMPGRQAPSFGTFIPNELCVTGIAQHLSAWAVVRARELRLWMGTGAPVH